VTLDSIPVRYRFRGGHVCHAYNEDAFRHFLAVERARAVRSQRFLYLALITLQQSPGRSEKIPDRTAAALFRGLGTSVREVDFVGWLWESQVAAAVLAQGPKPHDGNVAALIAPRLIAELKKRLSSTDLSRLRVRVVRLGGSAAV
jgi:hypothetical protein